MEENLILASALCNLVCLTEELGWLIVIVLFMKLERTTFDVKEKK